MFGVLAKDSEMFEFKKKNQENKKLIISLDILLN